MTPTRPRPPTSPTTPMRSTASCARPVGEPLNELSTAPRRPGVVGADHAADCTVVRRRVAAAVELRREPTQCNFQPMFDPNPPALCGPGTTRRNVFSEDFEDGLNGWNTASEVVFPGASGSRWVADSDLPKAEPGTAAYGPAPDQGQCDGSAEDFSSSDSIISPVINIPRGRAVARKLSFDHYVATELGFDGGNVKFRTGRKWKVIPALGLHLQPAGPALHCSRGQHEPDGRAARLHRHRRWRGHRARGAPSQVDLSALGVGVGATPPAPLRHRARRLRRHRRLVRRRRQRSRSARPRRPASRRRGGSEELTRTLAAMIARCEPRRSGSCPPVLPSSTGTPSRAATAGRRPGPSRWSSPRSSPPPSCSAPRRPRPGPGCSWRWCSGCSATSRCSRTHSPASARACGPSSSATWPISSASPRSG